MSAVVDIKDIDTDPQIELPNYALLYTNHKKNMEHGQRTVTEYTPEQIHDSDKF